MNMKKMKRLVALALSVVMVLAMSVVAFAEEPTPTTYSITINNAASGHTYEAYQIFAGDLSEDSNGKTLSNITWGAGVTTAGKGELGDAKTKAESLTTEENARNFAKEVASYLQNPTSSTSASGVYTISGLEAGYYLVKDSDNTLTNADDFYTAYIMEVVGNVTATPKGDKPSVEKKVQENVKVNNTTGDYGDKYNDTADYSIGDAVPFKLIGTVPDMSKYTKYKYTFHDTLAKSFDAVNTSSIKVYVAGDKAGTNNKEDITSSFEITSIKDSDSKISNITVSTNNLKGIKGVEEGKYIIVEYSAVLNSDANIGQKKPGNTNEVYLTYSNNPNQSGEGTPEEGKTPPDKVIVFTYKLNTNKIDGDTQKQLEGVTFNLYKKDANDTKKWAKVENGKLTGWADQENQATTLTSDSNGLFSVAGLDDGTYYIHEIATLSGYNKLEKDVVVVITADTSNGQNGAGAVTELTGLNVTADGVSGTGEVDAGTATISIANNKGSNLPSTGGIGTTIFYVVGGILMVGAAVLLITKRRAEN